MATVYIVTDGQHSDYHIVAVFSSKAKAEKYIADNRVGDIEEYILNEPYVAPTWVQEYRTTLDLSDGRVMNNATFELDKKEAGWRGSWSVHPNTLQGNYVLGVSHVSQEHAHKLAVEGRQAYLRDTHRTHWEERW